MLTRKNILIMVAIAGVGFAAYKAYQSQQVEEVEGLQYPSAGRMASPGFAEA